MAIGKIRLVSDRSVPKLKDKIEFTDIVNDSTTGGTQKPVSAEAVKTVRDDLSQEIADRGQAVINLKGSVTIANDTLGKIEANLNQEVSDRSDAITQEVSDRNAAILVEENRAKAEEASLAGAIAAASTSASNDASAEETRAIAEETRIEAKLDAEIATTDAEITKLNADSSTAGSVANAVKAEETRAIAEEARIEGKGDQEVIDRTAAITNEVTARDAAILVETNRAIAAESSNATSIVNESTRAQAAEAANGVSITNLGTTVAANKTAIETSLGQETTNRITADTTLSNRLNVVETIQAAGIVPTDVFETMADLDALVEADLLTGQGYFIKSEMDFYVAFPSSGGDYQPAGYTTKSFVKFADYNELSGLVNAEKVRAIAAEAVNASAIAAEASTRAAEDTRVEGLLSAETTRAITAEGVNASAVSQLDTDYKAADTAMTAAYTAADAVVDGRVTTVVATLNSTISTLSTNTSATITAEETRARGIEAGIQSEVDTLNDADTVIGSVAYAVKVEETRALAAEGVNATAIATETAARIADVDAEELRALTAEGVIDTKVDTEIQDRKDEITRVEGAISANKAAIEGRVDVLEADKDTVGSVAAAEHNAKVYFDLYAPQANLEGIVSPISVLNDSITLTYAPMVDGIVNGEIVVYHTDNSGNLEAVAVNVLSISGSVVTLDVTAAGEFDGDNVKVHYFFREADQSGAGMGLAGANGAGL